MNKILKTDSYKFGHFEMYDDDIEYMNYYIESRGGRWNRTVFFGLQMILNDFFSKQFTQEELDEAVEFTSMHGVPFNKEGWQYIIDKHNGYLPLKIYAVKEGIVLPTSNVLVQIINTDPKCFWLPGYVETVLLRAVWYPTTVATQGFFLKRIILDFLKESGTPDLVDFKLHDFGSRSSKCDAAAAIGGCAHLVNFKGTDTPDGIIQARQHYFEKMAGFSIPALEHSVVMSFGRENEVAAYSRFINKIVEGNFPIGAMVSDTYDLYNTIENIFGGELKNKIESCKDKVTLVIRPDSGNPVVTSTNTINKLMQTFGFSYNDKGYKVLPNHIRVIHGDGISFESIQDIIFEMKVQKLSGDNLAFGMGSKLLDQLDRDNLSFAMKCSAKIMNTGRIEFMQKDPKTDQHKRSKMGILSLECDDTGKFTTIEQQKSLTEQNILVPVFENGKILTQYSFNEIRDRVLTYI